MLPSPLTEANLKKAMADPRYTDSRHPESKTWRDKVAQGFATLYPDETLRGDHTDALPRHQGADGHIYASDGTRVASGTIRVRSYSRTVNGKVVEVAAHDRTGGSGATAPFDADKAVETLRGHPITYSQSDYPDGYHYRTERAGRDWAIISYRWPNNAETVATYRMTKSGSRWIMDGVACPGYMKFNMERGP